MNTITTKQLRENMPAVIRTLREGKPLRLTYRRKTVGTIEPQPNKGLPLRRGSPEAILHAARTLDFGVPESVKKDTRPIKERIAEMRDKDLGVRY